jgi:hypothetical protein
MGIGPQIGGNVAALNITAAVAIKATPGTVFRITVSTPGSAGNLVINDNTQTGGTNTAANQILSVPFGSLTAGQVITLEWPCANGITVSAVPTGGVFAMTYS